MITITTKNANRLCRIAKYFPSECGLEHQFYTATNFIDNSNRVLRMDEAIKKGLEYLGYQDIKPNLEISNSKLSVRQNCFVFLTY